MEARRGNIPPYVRPTPDIIFKPRATGCAKIAPELPTLAVFRQTHCQHCDTGVRMLTPAYAFPITGHYHEKVTPASLVTPSSKFELEATSTAMGPLPKPTPKQNSLG